MNRIEINCQTGEKKIIPLTAEELAVAEAALALQAEQDATKAGRQAAYDAAAAVFNGLSKGKQALWESVRLAVADAILAGDMASAKETLETVPALYEGAEDDRAMFLALFP